MEALEYDILSISYSTLSKSSWACHHKNVREKLRRFRTFSAVCVDASVTSPSRVNHVLRNSMLTRGRAEGTAITLLSSGVTATPVTGICFPLSMQITFVKTILHAMLVLLKFDRFSD